MAAGRRSISFCDLCLARADRFAVAAAVEALRRVRALRGASATTGALTSAPAAPTGAGSVITAARKLASCMAESGPWFRRRRGLVSGPRPPGAGRRDGG
jgi:hypothetical protein